MNKKLLIITYYWPPSGGAGVQRWLKFVKNLPKFNVTPIVLTVSEKSAHYPSLDLELEKDLPEEALVYKTKTTEPFKAYKILTNQKEIPYGSISADSKDSIQKKAANWVRANLFIPDGRMFWKKHAVKQAKKIIIEHGIDLVITTGPPHSTHLIGLKLKNTFNINWVADFRDPWVDLLFNKELPRIKIANNFDKKLESKVLSNADLIITVSNGLKEKFAAKAHKIEVCENGFDSTEVNASPVKINRQKFILSYIGNFKANQNTPMLWKAINELINEDIDFSKKFELRLVGKVSDNTIKNIEENKLAKHVNLMGYVQHDKAIEELSKADMLLFIVPDVSTKELIITGKIFEYLAAKKRILPIGPKNGDAATILVECEREEMIEYQDKEKMKEEIKKAYYSNDKKEIDPKNLYMKFDRLELTKKLVKILEKNHLLKRS